MTKTNNGVISAQDVINAAKNKSGVGCVINLSRFEKIGKISQKNYMWKVARQLLEMDKKSQKQLFPKLKFDELTFQVLRHQFA